jgi:hypothetical protein
VEPDDYDDADIHNAAHAVANIAGVYDNANPNNKTKNANNENENDNNNYIENDRCQPTKIENDNNNYIENDEIDHENDEIDHEVNEIDPEIDRDDNAEEEDAGDDDDDPDAEAGNAVLDAADDQTGVNNQQNEELNDIMDAMYGPPQRTLQPPSA